jgi:hypothetical protein
MRIGIRYIAGVAGCVMVGVAAAVAMGGQGSEIQPSGRSAYTDVVVAADVRELVRHSSLIVVGTPIGAPREVVLESGDSADYFQDVEVESSFRGKPTRTVTIVRNGLIGDIHGGEDHDVEGPLATGRQVFFLQVGGSPGTWSIVGHFQGDVAFPDGKTEGSEFPDLNGKTKDELRQMAAAFGEGEH